VIERNGSVGDVPCQDIEQSPHEVSWAILVCVVIACGFEISFYVTNYDIRCKQLILPFIIAKEVFL
jgi:hypothetical protein